MTFTFYVDTHYKVTCSIEDMSLEKTTKFLETYRGRDKILRTLSYVSKFAAGVAKDPKRAAQYDNFSSQLSACRAALRLLDDVPMIAYVFEYGLGRKEKDPYIQAINVVSNVVDLLFYPVDHMSWAIDHQVIVSNDSRWGTASTVCWIISLYLSILKATRQLHTITEEKLQLKGDEEVVRETTKELNQQQKNLLLNTLKYSADIIFAIHYLPDGILWSGRLKKWHVGALGSFSSLVGLYQVLR